MNYFFSTHAGSTAGSAQKHRRNSINKAELMRAGAKRFGGSPAPFEKYLTRFFSAGYMEKAIGSLHPFEIKKPLL